MTLRLIDPNGTIFDVQVHRIDDLRMNGDEDASNCILIIARANEGQIELLRMVPIYGQGISVSNFFKSWHYEPYDDGTHQHIDRQKGANIYGLIFTDTPENLMWLSKNLNRID